MRFYLFIFLLFSIASCVQPPEYSNTPTLEFRGFSKDVMRQGSIGQDSVTLVLYFTDGDGDFGSKGDDPTTNVFLLDKRTNQTFREYKAPFIPEEGAGNGISGTMSIKVLTTCCVYSQASGIPPCERSLEFPTNDLIFDIFITDRSGNKSNVVTTTPIKLSCI
ncbi:MAG: hypothetical protein WAU01_05700 [Saprospiraceae bacterium]